LTVTDPTSYTKTHIKSVYPGGGGKLAQTPDRISVQVHVKAIADEVLQDLVTSGDLDPSYLTKVSTLTPLSGTLEWTTASAATVPGLDVPLTCVVGGGNPYRESPNIAKSNARCTP